MDGDDWVEKEFCELPYRAAVENDADIVFFRRRNIDHDGNRVDRENEFSTGPMTEEQAFSFNMNYSSVAWLGLYRRALFDDTRFPAGKFYEDAGTVYRLIRAARSIYHIDTVLYDYRSNRSGSITTERETKFHPDRREMNLQKINDLYEWGYEKILRTAAFNAMIRYGRKGDDLKNCVKIVDNMIAERDYNIENNRKTPINLKKMALRLYAVSPALFDLVCILSGNRHG